MLKLCCILSHSTNLKLQKTIHWVKYTLATSCTKLGTHTAKYIVEKQIKLRFTRHHGQPDPKLLLIEDFLIRCYDAVETDIEVRMFRKR